jgi:hypothetical protein
VTAPLTQERIAIVDLADDLQVRKQWIFKILKHLSIRPTQRREKSRGNQNVATVSTTEAAAIHAEILKSSSVPAAGNSPLNGSAAVFYSDDAGYFYVIQLEPAHDPGRFKVGFTMDLDGRLQKHRCSAPFSTYLNTWPCKRVWERQPSIASLKLAKSSTLKCIEPILWSTYAFERKSSSRSCQNCVTMYQMSRTGNCGRCRLTTRSFERCRKFFPLVHEAQ